MTASPATTTSNATGPRTETGKATSARNALKNGLFADRDFILSGEQEEYTETLTRLWSHLQPQGVLEETFAAEIMTATWRLRRCRIVEAALALRELCDEDLAKEQKSVDRARAQANNTLRRSTAELRKLQSEAATRAELAGRGFDTEDLPGLVDSRQLLSAVQKYDSLHKRSSKLNMKDVLASLRNPGSFCNPPNQAADHFPDHAECNCGSGKEFGLCCGNLAA